MADYDSFNLGLIPIHPFNLEVKPLSDGYYGFSLYVNGEYKGNFCSPFTLYYDLVSKILPSCLNLYL